MATRYYLPAFVKLVTKLDRFLNRNYKAMVQLNNITGTELDQLNALVTACDNIVKNPLYSGFTEAP
jgi:hypothetical protein